MFKKILFWLPRVLSVLLVIFISIFALDVFNEYHSFSEIIIPLFLHLIPSLILIALAIVAWRWERIGGLIYIAFGIFYIITMKRSFHFNLSWILTISGPLFLIGLLFVFRKK